MRSPEVQSGLGVVEFRGGEVVRDEIWSRAEDTIAFGIGCFVDDECPAMGSVVSDTAGASRMPVGDLACPDDMVEVVSPT